MITVRKGGVRRKKKAERSREQKGMSLKKYMDTLVRSGVDSCLSVDSEQAIGCIRMGLYLPLLCSFTLSPKHTDRFLNNVHLSFLLSLDEVGSTHVSTGQHLFLFVPVLVQMYLCSFHDGPLCSLCRHNNYQRALARVD